jgi:hypothetical protein
MGVTGCGTNGSDEKSTVLIRKNRKGRTCMEGPGIRLTDIKMDHKRNSVRQCGLDSS